MANPLLERYAKPKHGQKSEKRIAKKLGARTQPASGSLPGRKGDSERPDFLIESKATVNDSLGLKLDWLGKIEKEALERNKAPALTISFVFASGQVRPSGDWVAIPRWLFQEHFG